MKKILCVIPFLCAIYPTLSAGEISIGADIVNRYVWRGVDQGNSISIQSGMSYKFGGFEIGTWASFAANGDHSESDIFLGYSIGPMRLSITDYTTSPSRNERKFFDFSSDGPHTIELMNTIELGNLDFTAAINVLNDDRNSLWLEAIYAINKVGDADLSIGIAVGNGVYISSIDGDNRKLPKIVSTSINVGKNGRFASYIINLNTEKTFFVIGNTF